MANEHLPLLGFDTETHRIAVGAVAPRMVCITAASRWSTPGGPIETALGARADGEMMPRIISMVLSGENRSVAHNLAYDLAVIAANYPELFPVIFSILEQELGHDTCIREKLLNLTTSGDLSYMTNRDGSKSKIDYKLFELVKFYYGRDRSAEKNLNDAWRLNFSVLEPLPSSEWPEDARKYAIEDSVDALEVFEAQELRRQEIIQRIGVDPFVTESFHVFSDFCLFLTSCWGVRVDPENVQKIQAMLEAELSGDKLNLLISTGILRPGEPARPNALGHKQHVTGCKKKWVEQGRTIECQCPVKMNTAIEPSIDMGKLRGYVEDLAKRNPLVKIKMTAPSTRFPEGQISTDAEWLESNAALDPVIGQLKHRQELQKLVTTEIPRMMVKDDKGEPIMGQPSTVVHPRYDVLKETGRTSSYGDKLVPSVAIQQIDPRVRECYIPRDGYLMFSVDLSYMELGTFAQTCINLFGFSKLGDVINAGGDPHTWLGAQIALSADPSFAAWVGQNNVQDRNEVWKLFETYKKSEHEAHREFFKHYRKLAKPTGLGYPGGLGAETFIAYAKATYGVEIDLATAEMLREVWRETVAEAVPYFDYINKQCVDPFNHPLEIRDPATGETSKMTLYRYTSPMGMYRAGCAYCAAANGLGLQTPSSEGAKLGHLNVTRACYDPSLGSILGDDDRGPTTRPLAFIHDEILGEVRADELAHDRVLEVGNIMVRAMRTITPNVTPRFGAALMRRWNKDAEAVYDSNNRLVVWEPKKKEGTP